MHAQRTKIAGLCLVMLLAASATMTASAAAAPPEVLGSSEGPLTSKSLTLQGVGGMRVICKNLAGSGGGAVEPKTISLFLSLQACALGKSPCAVTSTALHGSLGYVNKVKKLVGADLGGSAPPVLAEFECSGTPVVVRGSVIAKITPVNKATTLLKVLLTQALGVQKPKMLEGGVPDFPTAMFGALPEEEAGIALNATITLGTPVVITA